jgi:hypothetical protein
VDCLSSKRAGRAVNPHNLDNWTQHNPLSPCLPRDTMCVLCPPPPPRPISNTDPALEPWPLLAADRRGESGGPPASEPILESSPPPTPSTLLPSFRVPASPADAPIPPALLFLSLWRGRAGTGDLGGLVRGDCGALPAPPPLVPSCTLLCSCRSPPSNIVLFGERLVPASLPPS